MCVLNLLQIRGQLKPALVQPTLHNRYQSDSAHSLQRSCLSEAGDGALFSGTCCGARCVAAPPQILNTQLWFPGVLVVEGDEHRRQVSIRLLDTVAFLITFAAEKDHGNYEPLRRILPMIVTLPVRILPSVWHRCAR